MTITINRKWFVLALGLALAACNQAPKVAENPNGQTVGPIYVPPAARDISGVWWIQNYSAKITPTGGGDIPFTEQGRMMYEANIAGLKDGSVKDDARRVCLPDGIPRILSDPYPFEIIQAPGNVNIAYEINHVLRPIPLDATLPSDDDLSILPFYSGHSVAHWDGDTLVIESGGFNETTFLDATGVPHSADMKTVERVHRLDDKTLEWVVTVTDPAIFTAPWSARFVYDLHPEIRLQDYNCGDEHRDISKIPGVHPPV